MAEREPLLSLFEDELETTMVQEEPWHVLVVDDDDEVHRATRHALEGVEIFDRPVLLTHAYSSEEAREALLRRHDYAIVLLDMLLEGEGVGLELVSFIRRDRGLAETRIILRTDEAVEAPVMRIFRDYDINDYRRKDELSPARLLTILTSALRSYAQIRTVAENRRGLELVLAASGELMSERTTHGFALRLLARLEKLLLRPVDALLAAPIDPERSYDPSDLRVAGGVGRFEGAQGALLSELENLVAPTNIRRAFERRQSIVPSRRVALYLGDGRHEAVLYFETEVPLSETEKQLVDVFAANASACYTNLKLFERVRHAAYHDLLTGLANRSHFVEELDALSVADQGDGVVALIDVRNFADLNDGIGHEVGNALLGAIARRLDDELSEHCALARVGADVFGVAGPSRQVNPERLGGLFREPFAAGEHRLAAAVCIGLCQLRDAREGGSAALKRANIALNRAKRGVPAYHEYFRPEMEDSTRFRLDIIRRLEDDFAKRRLEVYYQPQVSLASARISGIEALLRWPGERGFVQPPNVFIPLAEQTGLIVDIGYWVIEQACEAIHRLRAVERGPSRVSVNVSMPQFRQAEFVPRIQAALEHFQLPQGSLELEITESVALDEPQVVQSALHTLRKMGVRVAVDDFGTGFSSLGHLRALAIDAIKIDQSFVREIGDGKGGMFVETVISLGQKLQVETIAEGVETGEQAGFLRELGCTEAQGYLYARPMPFHELQAWLAKWGEGNKASVG